MSLTGSGRVIVYGGRGALGSAMIDHFKSNGFWTLNIDLKNNEKADANILVDAAASWQEQEVCVLKSVSDALNGQSLDAILCVAGGWSGGNLLDDQFIRKTEGLMKQSLLTAAISARIAAHHLCSDGLLQLTGASAALQSTSSMIGYGLTKAAVHHLVRSLAADGSGMPKASSTLAILPSTLDTPMNRKWMKNADTSSWTTSSYICELIHKWISDKASRPKNGSLVEITTKENISSIHIH